MAILDDLAKLHGVKISEYLNPAECKALEDALSNKSKHAAAKVLIQNLEKKMKGDEAAKLKKGLNEMIPGLNI